MTSTSEFSHAIFYLRLIERFVITGLVLAVAVIVLIAFWRTVHRIDFNVEKEKVGVAGTTLIATPVLVLLILVGFAWVVLTNGISLEIATQNPAPTTPEQPDRQPKQPPESGALSKPVVVVEKYNGSNSTGENVAELLPSFNCAFAHVQNPTPEQERAIRLVKAEALLAHWPAPWTAEKETFRKWAIGDPGATANGQSGAVPNGNITQLFHNVDRDCNR
ncbi:hypothetical protein [Bradyrhizobium sp. AZCC 2230]|uniref:hypothetical protein n=1 Tax=Bradyrhizobium sp. AZCC 2230 TaxID=3117021 RepID=UPI002FEF80F4